MIINTQTVAVTLFVIGVAFYIGIGIIRRFALTIACLLYTSPSPRD